MREFGKVGPTFWTRGTGKALRGHPEAQIVALYLMSAPTSNMIGLYYLPVEVIAHDTGLPLEGASKGLRRAFEGGFCTYDEASEMVFVHTMAPRQLGLDDGEALSPKDNRVKAIIKLMKECGSPSLLDAFYELYRDRLCLPVPWWEGPSKGLARGFEGPSKGSDDARPTSQDPLRSQEQEQEQEQEQDFSRALPSTTEPTEPGAEKLGSDDLPTPPEPLKPVDQTPSKTAKPRQRKTVTDDSPEFARVTHAWFEAFEKAKGVKPVFDGKNGRFVNTLLQTFDHDVGKIVDLFANAFADPWWAKNRATLADLASNPNRFLQAPLPVSERSRGAYPVQSGAGGLEYLERLRAKQQAAKINPVVIPECTDDF